MQATQREDWGSDSEAGVLRDVLLCRPDNFRWLPTSAISRATLESGDSFHPDSAHSQHAEMVAAYEQAGVRCHFLEPDPALPYQVFARDSSVMTPWGAVVTQLHQWWRRGEYAPAIRFYQQAEIPIWRMVSAAALEGGDVVLVKPGVVLIGSCEERTEAPAARQLADWFKQEGWEARVQAIPSRLVHIDVLVSILADGLAAVCLELAPQGLVGWLDSKGFEILEVSEEDAMLLGVNAISLGGDRVLSSSGSSKLNGQLRARGLHVLDPDLSMFTRGGGGAHCLGQPLRREPQTPP